MSKSRIKVKLPTLTTREEAEAALNELALTENNRRKLIAQRDAAVLRIEENIAPDIAACETAIKDKTDALRAWAEANVDTFPKGLKSIVLVSGRIGFRTGTPKLKLLSGWNWDKVLEAIEALGFQFIRNKPEVDKEAIITFASSQTDRAAVDLKVLRPIGVKLIQDESFYVEPKLTDTDARQTVGTK